MDEHILGSDVSVEERTRCLLGVYMALATKTKPVKKAPVAEGEEASAAAAEAQQEEDNGMEARRAFKDNLLGMKVRLHKSVNDLLHIQSQLAAKARLTDQQVAVLERDKHSHLALLAKQVTFEHDATMEDIAAAINTLIFESKDKNILKYLRALANPLTEYEQIRVAQTQLALAVKQMPAHALSKNKKVSNHATQRTGWLRLCLRSLAHRLAVSVRACVFVFRVARRCRLSRLAWPR